MIKDRLTMFVGLLELRGFETPLPSLPRAQIAEGRASKSLLELGRPQGSGCASRRAFGGGGRWGWGFGVGSEVQGFSWFRAVLKVRAFRALCPIGLRGLIFGLPLQLFQSNSPIKLHADSMPNDDHTPSPSVPQRRFHNFNYT